MKKRKILLSSLFLLALSVTACGAKQQSSSSTGEDSSSSSSSSSSQSTSSRSSSSRSSSSSSSQSKSSSSSQKSSSNSQSSSSSSGSEQNLPLEQDELFYEVSFGNGVSGETTKWTKGKEYTWTFTNCEASDNVCFAIGAKMSDSSHGDRTLFTNHEGASSTDSFESNSANDGTPRFTVKVNNVQQKLFTYSYSNAGLNTSSMEAFKVAGMFSIPAGTVNVSLTAHASAGYRLYLGSFARLYYPNSGGSQGGGGQGTAGVFEFNDTELNTAQEIHTANQKAYLNYDQPYYEITGSTLNGFDAYGNKDVSTPNKVTLSWNYGVPDGKTLSKYSIVYGQKADLSDGYQVDGNTNKSISFYNPYLGTNYFKIVANFSDGSKQESEIKTFKVDTQCPRSLYVGNLPNCRDMGGRTTEAGGKIKQGLVFRTSGNKFSGSTAPNTEAKNILLNQLKVKTEINVADGDNNTVNLGNGVSVVNAYMNYGSTPYSNLARNAERIRQTMDVFADQSKYPVFFHCRIGTDRTGITAVMLGGLIGIPFNEVVQDYLFSNFAPIDNQRYPHKANDSNGDNIDKYIDELLALPGKNFQEKVYLALRIIGIPAAKLNTIIDIMTEGNKAILPDDAKLGIGEDLTTSVSKSTNTQYMAPATYYGISGGNSISYSASTTAGEKGIVVYMASTNTSINGNTTTKLADCITLKIDGVEKTIIDRTLHRAGFGQTAQSSNKRLGYMFNVLGNYSLSEGNHTIQISVKSGTFNIATIGII